MEKMKKWAKRREENNGRDNAREEKERGEEGRGMRKRR
jgi:hypothetical protein